MTLTPNQEVQKRLLKMAFDSIYVLTEEKRWDDSFSRDDAKLITEAMGNIACIIDEYFPDEHEHFIMDAIEEMEFWSTQEQAEEALEKSIRHNMKRIVGDADQLLETGDFLKY